jgi:NitT/TauT family transport system substrate-binding protein
MRASTLKWTLGILAVILVLVLLRFRPWEKPDTTNPDHTKEIKHIGPTIVNGRQTLTVAFVPVTCHLTCPITDFASKTSTTGTRFDALRFTEFPSIVESLKSKQLEAGFLTVPLAMKLREQGVPIKICCLGHRDGSQLVIRKEDPAKSLVEMKGKTIAIPSYLSNENFVIHKLMQDQGVQPDEIKFSVIPPPDMPTALATKSIDGFIVAEPFCSKSELDGIGRILYYAKDIWPHYISCCLVVHEDLIKEHPAIVQDLVRGIVESGEWAETNRPNAARLVTPYFRQDEKLLNYVLTSEPARVTYRMLNPTDAEIQKIMDMGMQTGQLKTKTPLSELMDRNYIPADVHPAKIDMTQFNGSVHP